ncbi:enoyl-CoA hydratase/isomerase family protein [Peribacillus alkalitolerans]|uniref:enoyl-CoA hydratase/isomerase family protein n=1 Tax=Peribacillus alkalitolerans TaxID=1550385 RepID=UPI0013D4083E|nr:enoyl-CoA hydratase-related protein [Peribacillus alkalitolerans]
MTTELYWKKDGATASLIINRPHKKNAFSLEMFQQLSILIEEIENDPTIKVLIIRGVDDSAFAAGADITEFLEIRLSAQKAKEYNDITLHSIDRLYRCRIPTIALIQSLAIGGGLELALACDFRIASNDSLLGITASKLGIVYNLTSTKRLLDVIGPSKTKELLFTGKLISASEGKEIGLIDYVYKANDIQRETELFAQTISERSSVSTTGIKKVIQAILDGEQEENDYISQLILDSFSSDDYKEGIAAFLEKRKPKFV